MNRELITQLHQSFEQRVNNEAALEYWFARDIQQLLGYSRWENFVTAVDKARESCRTSGNSVEDHFRDVTKMIELGKGGKREIADLKLTRYACYLIAQNGDPRKEEIAFAQAYFAIQTRKAEIIEQRLAEYERLERRELLTQSEKILAGVIFEQGVDRDGFARIKSKGDQALFGGRTTREMKAKLDVPESRALADFLPTVTVTAKQLANEMTTHNVKARELKGENPITTEHQSNNTEIRGALTRAGI